ncbi:hypothetical protein A9Q95_08450 [Rhodobacterales bacterium 59_46_T64]|nr:hypothetical protein A9Q95_08450 [Rhodobacterales bacterium 59_46_T64]
MCTQAALSDFCAPPGGRNRTAGTGRAAQQIAAPARQTRSFFFLAPISITLCYGSVPPAGPENQGRAIRITQ